MAWLILLTVVCTHILNISFGLMTLFKKPSRRSEPSGPFRRPNTEWQDWHPPRTVHYTVVNGRPVRSSNLQNIGAEKKVNWKEEGF